MQTTIRRSDIEAEGGLERRLMTLRLRRFDSQCLSEFVTEVLPQYGVMAHVDDGQPEGVVESAAPAPFQLAILLGGWRQAAQVVRLADGRTTVRLSEPFNDVHARADAAARHLQETGISYSADEVLAEMRSMTEARRQQLSGLRGGSDWRQLPLMRCRCFSRAVLMPPGHGSSDSA